MLMPSIVKPVICLKQIYWSITGGMTKVIRLTLTRSRSR